MGIIDSIKENSKKHGSLPFWSWNDRLEKNELIRQIRNMNDLGVRGFFMHARTGLKTGYMSEDWFDAVKICIDEAEKNGMEAWAYDENGWPSGFAGGLLLNDARNYAKFLKYERSENYPTDSDDILGVYVIEDGKCRSADKNDTADKYHIIRRDSDFSYVDLMDRHVTDLFIEETHAKYRRKLGEKYWRRMPGFFTDEPQYFRYATPWSDTFLTKFEERFGYSVLEAIPAMFLDFENAAEMRYDYHLLCHESYYMNFLKPISDWCRENGSMLTGHGIEEWGLGGQMMCCGGIMPFYLYEDIPGIDFLGRDVPNAMGAKQIGSVCAQTGKKVALTESFACCGWDVTPKELKRIAELQFTGGINLICEHLYPYSERGQRKRDYPLHYSEHNPWQSQFAQFEKHFANLGSALSEGREIANVLVIHPIRSAYLFYGHECYLPDGSEDKERIKEMSTLDKKFAELVDTLSSDQILYHFGDETILRMIGSVEEKNIRVGECVYDTVILPYSNTLDSFTVNLLKQYVSKGGKLCTCGRTPDRIDGRGAKLNYLNGNTTYEKIKDERSIKISRNGNSVPLHAMMRETESGKLIFVANTSSKVFDKVEIVIENCGNVCAVVPETLEKKQLVGHLNANGSVTVVYDFDDSESVLIIEDSELPLTETGEKEKHGIISAENLNFCFDTVPENMAILDYACVAENEGEISELRSVSRIRDNLLSERFEGDVTLEYVFKTDFIPDSLIFVAEPMKYKKVQINGMPISLSPAYSRFDRSFVGADISDKTHIGENRIRVVFEYYQSQKVYSVLYDGGTEARRNCLSFDTEVESAYLFGYFNVRFDKPFTDDLKNSYRAEKDFCLIPYKKDINLTDITSDGYPFFMGTMECSAKYLWKDGMPTVFRPIGRHATVNLSVNDEKIPGDIFKSETDLSGMLRNGENSIGIKITFSPRNLLGPHNRRDPDTFWVGPPAFSFEKEWKGAECPSFVEGYALIKEGI